MFVPRVNEPPDVQGVVLGAELGAAEVAASWPGWRARVVQKRYDKDIIPPPKFRLLPSRLDPEHTNSLKKKLMAVKAANGF